MYYFDSDSWMELIFLNTRQSTKYVSGTRNFNNVFL